MRTNNLQQFQLTICCIISMQYEAMHDWPLMLTLVVTSISCVVQAAETGSGKTGVSLFTIWLLNCSNYK